MQTKLNSELVQAAIIQLNACAGKCYSKRIYDILKHITTSLPFMRHMHLHCVVRSQQSEIQQLEIKLKNQIRHNEQVLDRSVQPSCMFFCVVLILSLIHI